MIIHEENPKVSTAKTLRTHKPIRQTCSIQSQHIESSHVSKQKHQITLFTEGPALGGGDGTAVWASLKCKGPEASLSGHSYMGPPTSVDETLLHRNPPERQGAPPPRQAQSPFRVPRFPSQPDALSVLREEGLSTSPHISCAHRGRRMGLLRRLWSLSPHDMPFHSAQHPPPQGDPDA